MKTLTRIRLVWHLTRELRAYRAEFLVDIRLGERLSAAVVTNLAAQALSDRAWHLDRSRVARVVAWSTPGRDRQAADQCAREARRLRACSGLGGQR
ncbi:hypothetical protein [Micromonospora sp. NPDC004704]